MPVAVVEAETLYSYLGAIQDISTDVGQGLWYRGVGAESYSLVPSLYRNPQDAHVLQEVQLNLIREFSSKSILMHHGSGPDDHVWRTLTHMQHYGVPTYMLDWSTSPLVALYFAISAALQDKRDEPALVYCLHPEKWNQQARAGVLTNPVRDLSELSFYGLLPGCINRTDPIAFWPHHSNPRIQRQQGTFVVFGNDKTGMESTVLAGNLRAIRIPNGNLTSLFSELQLLGISATSIYPDLYGLSFELRHKYGI
jgi:hypothetical protein